MHFYWRDEKSGKNWPVYFGSSWIAQTKWGLSELHHSHNVVFGPVPKLPPIPPHSSSLRQVSLNFKLFFFLPQLPLYHPLYNNHLSPSYYYYFTTPLNCQPQICMLDPTLWLRKPIGLPLSMRLAHSEFFPVYDPICHVQITHPNSTFHHKFCYIYFSIMHTDFNHWSNVLLLDIYVTTTTTTT